MKQIHPSSQSRQKQLLLWFVPTVPEFAMYLLITLLTVVVINTAFIRNFLLIPDGFSLQTALLGSFETSLTAVVGHSVAAGLISGVFWGLIGIIVYVLLKMFGNFSSELGNDIVVTRYMHPRGDDTYYPLKRLLLRIFFHVTMAIVFVLYINFFVGRLVPFFSTSLARLPSRWSDTSYLYNVSKMAVIEVFGLHAFVVLTRLLLLRKRVFGLGI